MSKEYPDGYYMAVWVVSPSNVGTSPDEILVIKDERCVALVLKHQGCGWTSLEQINSEWNIRKYYEAYASDKKLEMKRKYIHITEKEAFMELLK